jgi:hypothetical protein
LYHLRTSPTIYTFKLDIPNDTRMYNDPLYIELAQAAHEIVFVDVSKIFSENIQVYSRFISNVRILKIDSIPQTRQDIGNMNRLLARANPTYLNFGSFDIYMQPGFKQHIRKYNRIYQISFKRMGTEEIEVGLLRREIPRLLNSLNNVDRILLLFPLAAGPVFRQIQNYVSRSWNSEMFIYSNGVDFEFTRV